VRLGPTSVLAIALVALSGCAGQRHTRADVCPLPAALTGPPGPAWTGQAPGPSQLELRVDQAGYMASCPKRAEVLSRVALGGAPFRLLDAAGATVARGRVGPFAGPWSRTWPFVYELDLGALRHPGTYRLALGGASSPPFAVAGGGQLYTRLARDTVGFLTAQRDGPNVAAGPLRRRPAHLLDRQASVYRVPIYRGSTLAGPLRPTGAIVDVSGGWSDAGDYLKFVETTSFSEVLMLLTLRDYPDDPQLRAPLAAEARHGLEWLMKMWDQTHGVLYFQVGIGDGNGSTVLGDHDLWRLPQSDDPRPAAPGSSLYFVSHRPVFAANAPGQRISPNLAGRVSAAFGLCAQTFARADPAFARRCLAAGQTLYERADYHRLSPLVSSIPSTYYAEPEARDDLELGAIELFLATRRLGGAGQLHRNYYFYLPQAAQWADAYSASPLAGTDSLNLYDVSSLAHHDLVQVLRTEDTASFAEIPGIALTSDPNALIKDMGDELRLATRLAARDPFGLANPSTNLDPVPHALGYAVEARLYDSLTHTLTFEDLAQRQLQWVLGRNAWGSSFVVGAGSTYPHCLAHQVANLSGSLTGTGSILAGAVVNGPTDPANLQALGAPDGHRPCPSPDARPFSSFDRPNFGFLDSVGSPDTSEPAIDYAALALLAFSQQSTGRSPTLGPRLAG
jgi:hypothetical protein